MSLLRRVWFHTASPAMSCVTPLDFSLRLSLILRKNFAPVFIGSSAFAAIFQQRANKVGMFGGALGRCDKGISSITEGRSSNCCASKRYLTFHFSHAAAEGGGM
jgi:hypothetical protein